jgi:hypothetical protein
MLLRSSILAHLTKDLVSLVIWGTIILSHPVTHLP